MLLFSLIARINHLKINFVCVVLLLAFSQHNAILGQSIRLIDIVKKPGTTVPVEAQLNERGGYISFSRTYRSGCVGGYKIKLTFSKSLNLLQEGETFQATLNCEDCSTPCGYKWNIISLLAGNSTTNLDKYPNYVYNGNISTTGSSKGSSGVYDWDPGMMTNTISLKYEFKKDVPLTTIKIVVAGEYEIYYVFETMSNKGSDSDLSKPDLSCPWKSSYGNIYWTEGYYGSRSKTISGELYLRNGKWVYEGKWGRNPEGRTGKVFFEFDSPTTFTGYWSEGNGSRQTAWSGSGTCN